MICKYHHSQNTNMNMNILTYIVKRSFQPEFTTEYIADRSIKMSESKNKKEKNFKRGGKRLAMI